MLLYRLWLAACQVLANLELIPANKKKINKKQCADIYNQLFHYVKRKIYSLTTLYGISMTMSSQLLIYIVYAAFLTDRKSNILLGAVQCDFLFGSTSMELEQRFLTAQRSDYDDIITTAFMCLS